MTAHTMSRTSSNKKTGSKRKKTILNILLVLVIVGAVFTAGLFIYAASNLPAWDPQLLSGAKTTIIYDDQGQAAANLHAEKTELKLPLTRCRNL
jgi:penicillin-binding protein 1A